MVDVGAYSGRTFRFLFFLLFTKVLGTLAWFSLVFLVIYRVLGALGSNSFCEESKLGALDSNS